MNLLSKFPTIAEGMSFLDKYNVFWGGVVAVLSTLLGQFWYLFFLYLLFNILDWLTGWHRANKLGQEASGKGWQGIKKKVWSWVILAVAFALPIFFIDLGRHIGVNLSFLELLGWFVLASMTVNEARSILENLAEAGYDVPSFLIKGLSVTGRLIKGKTDAAIPDDNREENDFND